VPEAAHRQVPGAELSFAPSQTGLLRNFWINRFSSAESTRTKAIPLAPQAFSASLRANLPTELRTPQNQYDALCQAIKTQPAGFGLHAVALPQMPKLSQTAPD
jgi:hypothetical protein